MFTQHETAIKTIGPHIVASLHAPSPRNSMFILIITANLVAGHFGIACDGCNLKPIVGERYKCNECGDYDLCGECKEKGIHYQHAFTQYATPLSNLIDQRTKEEKGKQKPETTAAKGIILNITRANSPDNAN